MAVATRPVRRRLCERVVVTASNSQRSAGDAFTRDRVSAVGRFMLFLVVVVAGRYQSRTYFPLRLYRTASSETGPSRPTRQINRPYRSSYLVFLFVFYLQKLALPLG